MRGNKSGWSGKLSHTECVAQWQWTKERFEDAQVYVCPQSTGFQSPSSVEWITIEDSVLGQAKSVLAILERSERGSRMIAGSRVL
jgi:hypothetical protein